MKSPINQYRDLEINKSELFELIKSLDIGQPVEIRNEHVVHLLISYKKNELDLQQLLEWVNIVWFSDLYEYADEHADCIASVLNELEELDEKGKILTSNDINRYVVALQNNIEMS
ncbi:MAG: hypothetical protein P0Y55_08620 [Candidatus Cohnella colombiensis]|uniref:Uncharacterized protein n=1 Tax=Candidatus Cohnella colombiensis TaxID=3121368 RepID=A0AA95JHK7_9BACL|nr:MAG: hypothetical protein P0Y55_08620 [Cohnella sp.]